MPTNTEDKIKLGQIEDINFSDIKQTPTTLAGYGITDSFTQAQSNDRFVRYDIAQGLTGSQQLQARQNIGVPEGNFHDPVTIGTANGLSLSDQVLSLALATTTTAGAMSISDKIKLNGIAANANNYVHPTQGIIDTGILTNKQVVSRIQVNSLGHVTAVDTRTNLPYVDFTSAETITGLKTIRRAGPNDGSAVQPVLGFEIGTDNLYKTWLMNSQNELSLAGEVNWFFRMSENYNSSPISFDRIGFHRGGLVVLGDRLPSQVLSTEIAFFTTTATGAFPYSTYIKRSALIENRLIAGQNNLNGLGFLGLNDRIYTPGRVYAKLGYKTSNPNDTELDGFIWKLGNAFTSSDDTVNRLIEVSIDGVVYEILAREKGSQPPSPDPVDPDPNVDVFINYTIAATNVAGDLEIDDASGTFTESVTAGESKFGNLTRTNPGATITITANNSDVSPAITLIVNRLTPSFQNLYNVSSPIASDQYVLTPEAGQTYEILVNLFKDDE